MIAPRRITAELCRPISYVLGSTVIADYIERHFEFILTPVEGRILGYFVKLDVTASGKVRVTYRQIAAFFHKSVRTIEHQIQRLIRKGVLIRRGRWLYIAGAAEHKVHQCGHGACIAESRSFQRAAQQAPVAGLLARQEELTAAPAKIRAKDKALAAVNALNASLRAEVKRLRAMLGLSLPYAGEFAAPVNLDAAPGFSLPAFDLAPRSRSSGGLRPEPGSRL